MTSSTQPATAPTAERWYKDKRVGGLARFAIALTTLNILGHLWLGFEQAWITPFIAVGSAYFTEIALEYAAARGEGRTPRFLGKGFWGLVVFLLSAHVSGLAVGMLLMPLEQFWVVAFGASVAVASKYLFQVSIGGRMRHVLNPSNFAIALVLLTFPSVGISPPYQFTEGVAGPLDWGLPLLIICTGSLLNTKFTGRMPLIFAWIAAFFVQALLRATIHGTPLGATLMPMTGFVFVIFSFYMITDPATSPSQTRNQIYFGIAVAALYAVFMELHIVFGIFYALALVTIVRGLWFAGLCNLIMPTEAPKTVAQPVRPAE